MVFNSVAFLVFMLLFFPIYWWMNNRYPPRVRNLFVLGCSYFFYAWWDWRFCFLLLFSSTFGYFAAQAIQNSRNDSFRKRMMILSAVVHIGIIGYFKYFNFFAASFVDLVGVFGAHASYTKAQIILPLAISFFTFHILGYTVDIYKRAYAASDNYINFITHIAYFPQLVAGPIERAGHLLPQFTARKTYSYPEVVAGLRLLLWGLFKKVVIADNLGQVVDQVFKPGEAHDSVTVLAGIFLFSFQIYCDFSGYSDMAIGMARGMGIELLWNFRTPYLAGSIRDFWHRWHISLSTWFRDYVYIPLGGSRVSRWRKDLNLFITFVVSGLWHGANFTFIIWGALHGFALVVENYLSRMVKVPKRFSFIPVFIVASFFWLPFRAASTGHLFTLLHELFAFHGNANELGVLLLSFYSPAKILTLFCTLLFFVCIEWQIGLSDFSQVVSRYGKWTRRILYNVILILIVLLSNVDVKPYFIYFQF